MPVVIHSEGPPSLGIQGFGARRQVEVAWGGCHLTAQMTVL